MEKTPEIVVIKAACLPLGQDVPYWLFSRRQLEFLYKEVEINRHASGIGSAVYRGLELPVVRLEQFFGMRCNPGMMPDNLMNDDGKTASSGYGHHYLVMRDSGEDNQLSRLVIETFHPLKMHGLKHDFQPTTVPEQFKESVHSKYLLAAYRLGSRHLGLFPDIGAIAISLQRVRAQAH